MRIARKTAAIIGTGFLLFVSAALAETGKIVKVGSETYSQSAHIVRNRAVYWLQSGSHTFKIARRQDRGRVVLRVGESVQFRAEPTNGKRGVIGHIFIPTTDGKEVKYDLIGESDGGTEGSEP